MKITPQFLLLLPPGLFWVHTEFTTAKSLLKMVEKVEKWRLLIAEQFSFLSLFTFANFNSIPQSTILCNETWAGTFHIDLYKVSLSWDLFLLPPPTLLFISIVSLIFMSPWLLYCNIFSLLLVVIRTEAFVFFPRLCEISLFYSNVKFMLK